MESIKLFTVLAISIVILSFSNAAQAAGKFVKPLPLVMSSQTPVEGEELIITIKGGDGANNARSALFYGTRPGHTGALSQRRKLTVGRANSNGDYTYAMTIPQGLKGTEIYFQGFTKVNGKVRATEIKGMTVIPNVHTDADWRVTQNSYTNVATGQTHNVGKPIESAFNNAQPGDVIHVQPGLNHPRFKLDRQSLCNNPDSTEHRIWIIGEGADNVKILRHTSGGSPTIKIIGCNINMVNLRIQPSDMYGIELCPKGKGQCDGIEFHNVHVEGEWDWLTNSGFRTKWGMMTYEARYLMRNSSIRKIGREHAIYHHNTRGATLEDSVFEWLGRTCTQFSARSTEGNIGQGLRSFRNVTCRNAGLGDYYEGGTPLTFGGRHPDRTLVQNTLVESGYDDDLNGVAGHLVGTGALVAHCSGTSYAQGIKNGPILVTDSVFRIADGDRSAVDIQCADAFQWKNSQLTTGHIGFNTDLPRGPLKLDRRLNNQDVYAAQKHEWNDVLYETYRDLLNAVYN